MQKLILLFLLPFIFHFKLIGQNNDVVRCDKFTIDNNIFSTSNNYINAVETAISHIEFPPNVVVRNTDKLAEISDQISEEKNMKSFGKTNIRKDTVLNAKYSISCNAIKDAPNEQYTLKVEMTDISGNSISKSVSSFSIVFEKKDFEIISNFEIKLTKELDKEFAFDKILGLQKKNVFLANQKINKQKVAKIDSLNKKLAIMENNFAEINKKDAELEKLKHTKPEVQCHLILTEKGIDIEFNFSNEVPIEFDHYASVYYNFDTINRKWLSRYNGGIPAVLNPEKIYPKQKKITQEYMNFTYHKFEKGIKYYFYMGFKIKSIYYEEIGDEKLKYDLLNLYEYDTTNKKITFLSTWHN